MRTLDATYLNEVSNHPDVRPWLKGEGPVDLTALVADPANITLQYEGGGWFLQNLGGCVYEVHSMFTPESRGRHVAKCLAEALEYVFVETDAVKLVTRLPKGNVNARSLGQMAGFRPWFMRGEDEYAVLAIEDWINNSYSCKSSGEWFHKRLEEAKAAAGSPLPTHDEDAAHDAAVGAAVLMCKAGNAAKGVWHYNQWARFAGYAPVTLVSASPLIVDVVDAVLHGPDMEVMLCR